MSLFTETRRPWLLAMALLIVTTAALQGVCRCGFLNWDDPLHTYQNPALNPLTASHLARLWRAPYAGEYVPVTYTVFALLSKIAPLPVPTPQLGGVATRFNPHVFHAANLALHLLNVALVFFLLRRLVRQGAGPRRDAGAFAGALLFAVHPVQVESVAWVSELRGLLAASCGLMALHLYLAYARAAQPGGGGLAGEGLKSSRSVRGRPGDGGSHVFTSPGRPALAARGFQPLAQTPPAHPSHTARRFYALALSAFVLALLSKPSAAALPLLAWTLDFGIARRPLRQTLPPLAGWALTALPIFWLTRRVQPVPPGLHLPLWQRPLIAGDALAFYLSNLLVPLRLGIDYGRTPSAVLHGGPACVSGLTVVLLLSLLAWRLRRQQPWLPVALALFVAALLPVLGFVPFLFQNLSTVGDRYLYLALLGPAFALASVWPRVALPLRLAFAAAVLFGIGVSARQVTTWRDSRSVYEQTLAVNPDCGPMHYNLAGVYAEEGDKPAAIAQYRASLRALPNDPTTHCYLGSLLADCGDKTASVAELRTATRLDPRYALAHYRLAESLAAEGCAADALAEWRTTARLAPQDMATHFYLARALSPTRPAEAAAQYREVLRLRPGYAPALQALRRLGGGDLFRRPLSLLRRVSPKGEIRSGSAGARPVSLNLPFRGDPAKQGERSPTLTPPSPPAPLRSGPRTAGGRGWGAI